jgi:FixJ family two-component response regulator
VAVVDDDDGVRTSLARLLRARGFAVQVFGSGEALLAHPAAALPDCLVLDIRLGGMSGIDLRRQLLARGTPAPVVFITALEDPATADALRGQAVACLLKPVEEAELLEAIDGAIESGRGDRRDPPGAPEIP